MRDTLGGDLATVPGHKARRRQGTAAVPPHQIVSPSLSQSESPVAVDLRIQVEDGKAYASRDNKEICLLAARFR